MTFSFFSDSKKAQEASLREQLITKDDPSSHTSYTNVDSKLERPATPASSVNQSVFLKQPTSSDLKKSPPSLPEEETKLNIIKRLCQAQGEVLENLQKVANQESKNSTETKATTDEKKPQPSSNIAHPPRFRSAKSTSQKKKEENYKLKSAIEQTKTESKEDKNNSAEYDEYVLHNLLKRGQHFADAAKLIYDPTTNDARIHNEYIDPIYSAWKEKVDGIKLDKIVGEATNKLEELYENLQSTFNGEKLEVLDSLLITEENAARCTLKTNDIKPIIPSDTKDVQPESKTTLPGEVLPYIETIVELPQPIKTESEQQITSENKSTAPEPKEKFIDKQPVSDDKKPTIFQAEDKIRTNIYIQQKDTFLFNLSNEQVDEFISLIHRDKKPDDHPLWFRKFSKWHQTYIKNKLITLSNAANGNEQIFRDSIRKYFGHPPANMRLRPGLSNHFLSEMNAVTQDGEVIFTWHGERSSFPGPDQYFIQENAERIRLIKSNLKQVILGRLPEMVQQFCEKHQPGSGEIIPIPILLQTLLSPLVLDSEILSPKLTRDNNHLMVKTLRQAVIELQLEIPEVVMVGDRACRLRFIAANRPANDFRNGRKDIRTPSEPFHTNTQESLQVIDAVLDFMPFMKKHLSPENQNLLPRHQTKLVNLLNTLRNSTASNAEKFKIVRTFARSIKDFPIKTTEGCYDENWMMRILSAATWEYAQLTFSPTADTDNGLNKQLHMAALENIMIHITGGIKWGSCKSGQDRKGYLQDYIAAMLSFMGQYGRLPRFGSLSDCEQVVRLFEKIEQQGHNDHVRAAEMPGSDARKERNRIVPPAATPKYKEEKTEKIKKLSKKAAKKQKKKEIKKNEKSDAEIAIKKLEKRLKRQKKVAKFGKLKEELTPEPVSTDSRSYNFTDDLSAVNVQGKRLRAQQGYKADPKIFFLPGFVLPETTTETSSTPSSLPPDDRIEKITAFLQRTPEDFKNFMAKIKETYVLFKKLNNPDKSEQIAEDFANKSPENQIKLFIEILALNYPSIQLPSTETMLVQASMGSELFLLGNKIATQAGFTPTQLEAYQHYVVQLNLALKTNRDFIDKKVFFANSTTQQLITGNPPSESKSFKTEQSVETNQQSSETSQPVTFSQSTNTQQPTEEKPFQKTLTELLLKKIIPWPEKLKRIAASYQALFRLHPELKQEALELADINQPTGHCTFFKKNRIPSKKLEDYLTGLAKELTAWKEETIRDINNSELYYYQEHPNASRDDLLFKLFLQTNGENTSEQIEDMTQRFLSIILTQAYLEQEPNDANENQQKILAFHEELTREHGYCSTHYWATYFRDLLDIGPTAKKAGKYLLLCTANYVTKGLVETKYAKEIPQGSPGDWTLRAIDWLLASAIIAMAAGGIYKTYQHKYRDRPAMENAIGEEIAAWTRQSTDEQQAAPNRQAEDRNSDTNAIRLDIMLAPPSKNRR